MIAWNNVYLIEVKLTNWGERVRVKIRVFIIFLSLHHYFSLIWTGLELGAMSQHLVELNPPKKHLAQNRAQQGQVWVKMIFSVLISSGIQSNVLVVDSEEVIAKREYIFIIYNYNIWAFHNKGNSIVQNNCNISGLTMKIILQC